RHPQYFDPAAEPFDDGREAYAPLVWQCRYSGIEVRDALWRFAEFGKGRKYSDNQAEHLHADANVFATFDDWVAQFAGFVERKGKVEHGRYRAYGYQRPAHRWAD